MHPAKKAARIAGAIYLSMVITGPFSLIYVPGKLIVRGNATATAANVLAHDTMFRFAIVAGLFGQVIFICVMAIRSDGTFAPLIKSQSITANSPNNTGCNQRKSLSV